MKDNSVSTSSSPTTILSVRIAPTGTSRRWDRASKARPDREDDQDRQRDPMPVPGERRSDAPLAGVLVQEPEEPEADIAPRPKDDNDENGNRDHAIDEDRGGNGARRGQDAERGREEDKEQGSKPVIPEEAMSAPVGDRRDPHRGQRWPQEDPEEQQEDPPGHEAPEHDRRDLGLGAGLCEQGAERHEDHHPERHNRKPVEERERRHAPESPDRGKLPGNGMALGAGEVSDAGFGKECRYRRHGEEAEIGPRAAPPCRNPIQPVRQPCQVGPDFRVSAKNVRNVADCIADPVRHQRLFILGGRRPRRRRGLCHQSLVGEGLKHRLPDRFYQLVILLLGHPGRRRRLRLRIRESDRERADRERSDRQEKAQKGEAGETGPDLAPDTVVFSHDSGTHDWGSTSAGPCAHSRM